MELVTTTPTVTGPDSLTRMEIVCVFLRWSSLKRGWKRGGGYSLPTRSCDKVDGRRDASNVGWIGDGTAGNVVVA